MSLKPTQVMQNYCGHFIKRFDGAACVSMLHHCTIFFLCSLGDADSRRSRIHPRNFLHVGSGDHSVGGARSLRSRHLAAQSRRPLHAGVSRDGEGAANNELHSRSAQHVNCTQYDHRSQRVARVGRTRIARRLTLRQQTLHFRHDQPFRKSERK